ncbi:anion transporter [Geminocystis sp. GBBB08]|uniref:anion transporter n=1 Tax=Geminocystis sp. GBBB08 TaxID=2604140 RepID=UPI0027E3105E|nr:anion transporter [Geminocystis sp. GBBB08]MBL1210419.1 anion transporter [Geminocystis sp. GBBB08]
MILWQVLIPLVIIVSYISLGLGYIPGLRLNRATIALITAAILIALGVLTLKEAWIAIDANTIIFLLSMMIINGYLSYSGFFNLALSFLWKFTLTPLFLIVLLTFSTGFLSALFLNDTLVLITTPFILQLTSKLKLNPIPYLLAIAGATNIGSLATLNGNPQNILIGSSSGISYLEFTQALIFPSIFGLIIQIGLLWLLYPEIRSTERILLPKLSPNRIHRAILGKTLMVTLLLLIAFVLGFPLAESAFLAAAILLITRRLKPQKILKQIDWSLLVMFSGLFILSHCVKSLNLFNFVRDWLNFPFNLTIITSILSNLISNVPAVLLLQGLMSEVTTEKWLLLASSATLAGNLTLFGSVANLIMVESVAKEGYQLSFWQHLRFGLPLTIITTGLTYLWIMK